MWVMIPCNLGSEIDHNIGKLITILYQSDWLDSDLGHKKNIIIMQTIMQINPIKVKAGIYFVDLENSVKLINAIYSFVAVARQIKRQGDQ